MVFAFTENAEILRFRCIFVTDKFVFYYLKAFAMFCLLFIHKKFIINLCRI